VTLDVSSAMAKEVSFSGASLPKKPDWKLPAKYELKTIIGSGSYGSVCEAKLKPEATLVAIKRMKHLFDDLIDCKRILREISILSKLKHKNVVGLSDVFIGEGDHMKTFDELYMVMEICDSDLKKLVRTDVNLSLQHVDTLLYNLLVGLKYLHSAGIYHRDLKPANCLVNQDCSVKICDFGLSRAVGVAQNLGELPNTPREGQEGGAVVPATQRLKRHLTGHVVTRWYRAPELILLQENYTEKIDIWSVGCIYAELLGMLDGAGVKVSDRGPLFPGSSCFPLSPDHKHKTDYKYHTRGKHDQLNMIFNLLGTPAEGQVIALEREDAKKYLKCFAAREGDGLKSKFSKVPDSSIDLLQKMLLFNPDDRTPVASLLINAAFKDITVAKDVEDAIRKEGQISNDFEKEQDLDDAKLRKYFHKEICKYHPDQPAP